MWNEEWSTEASFKALGGVDDGDDDVDGGADEDNDGGGDDVDDDDPLLPFFTEGLFCIKHTTLSNRLT